MSLLITPTLLNSFNWLNNCPSSWKEKAKVDMSNMLNRVWVEQPPDSPMKKGMEFEDAVYKCVSKKLFYIGSEEFQKTCKFMEGGTFQKKSKKIITVDGKEYCLYGKLDVFFPNKIVDIKTTGNWNGDRKYLETWQHLFYTWIEKIEHFQYYVIVWAPDKKFKIKETHIVDYRVESFDQNLTTIIDGIKIVLNMFLWKAMRR